MEKKRMNKRGKKKEIFFPTFFVLLLLLFGIPGLLALYFTNMTIKSCKNEVVGFVDHEGSGGNNDLSLTVEGKYVSVGKNGQHWIAIYVNTDDIFWIEKIYANKSYGSEGDKLIIHYNPDDPNEYYIGDYTNLNSFGVAAVLLVISGIILVLSIFTSIYYTFKEDTQEDKAKKQNEKKKKDAERVKKGKERIERSTKRYTKNYKNPHIRKIIQDIVIECKMALFLLILGAVLCLLSLTRTYIDIHMDNPVPFNNYPDNIDDTIYSVVIDEKPTKVINSKNEVIYNDLKVGNDHILAVNPDEKKVYGMDGPIRLRGKLRRIRVSDEEKRDIVKSYYQGIGYYDTLKDEEYAYYVLDCSKISLWEETKNNHIFGFVFGLTFIIIGLMFSSPILYMIKCLKPACSGRRYRAEEIDRLANDIDTEWVDSIEVLVTPSTLIGLNRGLTVVDYSDIYGIRVETIDHKTKHRKWKTYRIIIETKKHKKMLLTETESGYGARTLPQYLDKRFVEYKILDEKK